jgi:hypothetical protein
LTIRRAPSWARPPPALRGRGSGIAFKRNPPLQYG